MLSGATWSAAAIVGTPVFRIVVSRDSMKNATAISQGNSRLLESANDACAERTSVELRGLTFVGLGGIIGLLFYTVDRMCDSIPLANLISLTLLWSPRFAPVKTAHSSSKTVSF